MTGFPDHPFWDFSLEVYMAPGVGEACLLLQERHQVDVNLLLFCLWVGASGRGTLGDGGMDAAVSAVRAWHDQVVRPLRAVRTRMKGGMPPASGATVESLRRRIQKIEIDCEHTEQLMLAASAGGAVDGCRPDGVRAADAVANLARYFAGLGIDASDEDRGHVSRIVGVAFPGLPPSDIGRLCGGLSGGGRRALL